MSTATRLMTADDLWSLPDDHQRHELVRGVLRTYPLRGMLASCVSCELGLLLGQQVRDLRAGVCVFRAGFLIETSPDTVRTPDIAFVRQERIDVVGIPEGYFPGPPDLAMEVPSFSDTIYEVDEKVEDWLNVGTKLVWVVNPKNHTVTVYRQGTNPVILTENDALDGGAVVPGFSCRVGDIFA